MKSDKFGYPFLINTIILFSTYEVVSKTLVNKVDPFQINFLRFFLGGILLFFFILFKGDIAIKFKDFVKVAIVGVINVFFSMNLLQLSLNVPDSKASIVAVIFSSNPIFVTLFAALIDKEKINLHKVIGLMLGVAGIVFISLNRMQFDSMNLKSPVLALLSAILYGIYTVFGRKVSSVIGSLKMNCYSFLSGSLILLPFLLFMKVPVVRFEYSATLQILYLSILVTGVAYLTYFMGLTLIGASKGSLVFFLKPVLATIFSIVFLGEIITINFVLGTILIILGIVLVLYWNEFAAKIGVKNK